jgi:hypothetical protein
MTAPAPKVPASAVPLIPLCPCPRCGVPAIVELTPAQRLAQPDDTTHVCHPLLGGCNHGFTDERTRETHWRVYTYDARGVRQDYPELYATQTDAAAAASAAYRAGRFGGFLHFIEATP